jgi:hypothetical protein
MFLHGEGVGGSIADNGNFYSSNFLGRWASVVCYGSDAQANNFYGCNYAGSPIQFLDMSLLGNQLHGGHFAFNVGFVSVFASQAASLFGVYFETGTSYMGAGGCHAYGCLGMRNGLGIQHFGQSDDIKFTGNTPAIVSDYVEVLGISGGSSGGMRVNGPAQFKSANYSARFENVIESSPHGSQGVGLELGRNGNVFHLKSYDYEADTYSPLALESSQIRLKVGSVIDALDDAAASDAGVEVGGVYRNGSQLMLRVM